MGTWLGTNEPTLVRNHTAALCVLSHSATLGTWLGTSELTLVSNVSVATSVTSHLESLETWLKTNKLTLVTNHNKFSNSSQEMLVKNRTNILILSNSFLLYIIHILAIFKIKLRSQKKLKKTVWEVLIF